ncbi:hypothetical protein FDN13_12375 [Caloramator sp. E03]|uniref:hypothetical protein n=1 Tax=Caloramator sp. E03 TaxID=2576307 RepID=UPI001110D657|nr:hypothetical protein [Caloramator sp. E03]QCX34430.1 hypothetical protein FDN13_12375 [Caloramator sp. E03]
MILLCACNKKDNNDFIKAKNKLNNMKSYSSLANITVYGNKGISEYKVKQYCVLTDKIRIETIEPSFLKGKITVYSDGKWKVFHPLINKTFYIDNLRNIDQIVYLGVIQRDLFVDKGAKYRLVKKDDKELIEITKDIPKESEYGKEAALYIEMDNYSPIVMEIIDSLQRVKVRVKYENFKYNEELDNSIFVLE